MMMLATQFIQIDVARRLFDSREFTVVATVVSLRAANTGDVLADRFFASFAS